METLQKRYTYMKQPEGYIKNPKLLCKLNRSLYGLKQAPGAWNARFDAFVRNISYVRSNHDMCLYVKRENTSRTYILLYVDDIILTGNDEREILKTKEALKEEFDITDLGNLKYFLGIKIERFKEGIFLSQAVYIKNLLKRFRMDVCNSVRTPIEIKPIK